MGKTAKAFWLFMICLFLCASMALGFFMLPIQNFAYAEATPVDEPPSTLIEPVSDNYFSLSVQTSPRENQTVSFEKKEITDNAGITKPYICFKWSELEVLRFVINFSNTNENLKFNYYSFSETYTVTDDMQTPLAPMPNKNEPTTTNLFSKKTITTNSIVNSTFNYYIDSTYPIEKSDIASAGKDFGLYKFVLTYNYSITTPADITGRETERVLEFYIAVLPTEITEDVAAEIQRRSIQILYRVTNDRLMNKYILWLTDSDVLAYINPRYIKWKVNGKDSQNHPYVLDDNQRGQGGEKIVYDASPYPPYGTNFEFSSNGIEGHWDITCEIEDAEGNIIFSKTLQNLSTYRIEKKSNLWWILLIIFGSLFLILVLILIIYFVRKKRDSVW